MVAELVKAVVILFAGAFLATVTVGCGRESVADTSARQQVYFDRESQQPVVADAGLETPAVNPASGRRTLMPALYCRQCQAWRAAPPLDTVQRNPQARQCARCRSPLSADGPLPNESE